MGDFGILLFLTCESRIVPQASKDACSSLTGLTTSAFGPGIKELFQAAKEGRHVCGHL